MNPYIDNHRLSRRRLLTLAGGATLATASGLRFAQPASAATGNGIDYSDPKPAISATVAAGYTFVCRYLSWLPNPKVLTASEAQSLIAAGLNIVSNWESDGLKSWQTSVPADPYSQGVSHATEAQNQALACGMPATRPIYFSVDFDLQPAMYSALNSYFDGVASVIGRSRTGAYAGYYVIQELFNNGTITWGWQANAWSYGNWDSRAQLRQVQNDITVGGVGCDLDQSIAADFGQWGSSTPSGPDDETNGSVVIGPNGHMYKFARGTDNTLRMWSSDFTTGWVDKGANLGGSIAGSPAAIIAPNNHMYVFARGTDNNLHMWSSDFTNGWIDNNAIVAGGTVAGSSPTTVIGPDKHMYVFTQGTDNNLRMWSSDFTTGWVDKGAVVAGGAVAGSAPNAIIGPDKHMYVFARGTDNNLRMWSSNFTTGWVDEGAVVPGGTVAGSSPTSVIAPNNHMYVFARGTDNNLRMWSSDFTTGWVDKAAAIPGGAVDGGAPASVIAPANKHMYVFARGTDDNLRMWSSDFTTGWVDKAAAVPGGAIDAS